MQNTFPEQRYVENKVRIDVWRLPEEVMGGCPTSICIPSNFGMTGNAERIVELVEDRPAPRIRRLWFVCGGCGQKARHIYLPEIACRQCCRADYRCRYVGRLGHAGSGGNPAANVARLRRWLHVDPTPFAPIALPQRRQARWWKLMTKIAAQESKLLSATQRFAEGHDERHR